MQIVGRPHSYERSEVAFPSGSDAFRIAARSFDTKCKFLTFLRSVISWARRGSDLLKPTSRFEIRPLIMFVKSETFLRNLLSTHHFYHCRRDLDRLWQLESTPLQSGSFSRAVDPPAQNLLHCRPYSPGRLQDATAAKHFAAP